MAVPQINSQVWLDVRSAVDAAGGDSSKIKFVEAPDQLGALKSGNVDASTSSEPKGTAAVKDPALKHLDNYTTAEGGLAYMLTATQQMADENPATVAAFQRAILKANDKTNSDAAYRAGVAKKLRPFAQVPRHC
ncbi:ABC transporter substrate-binding protein [Streptomyces sp. NPDC058221]|uniref:ABC transporter substrate-binding protein n=1 Tax=Streptomyces sp. NPDC058221 TaxID=3346388 RepID=UPI0036E64A13